MAEQYNIETCKLAENYLNEKNNQSVRYYKSIIMNLLDYSKKCFEIITDMKKEAILDNESIYKEVIPDIKNIKYLDNECLVKNLNFLDINQGGQKVIHSVTRHNIFSNVS